MLLPEKSLFRMPGGISWKDAVLAEPLSISLHAVQLAKIDENQHIGIIGTGSIGLLLLKTLRLLFPKNRISSSDILRTRNRLALKNGTFKSVTPDNYRFQPGQEPEILFECAGKKECLDLCIHAAKPGGKIIIIGIQDSPELRIDAGEMRRKELTLTYVRRQNGQVDKAISLLAKGLIKTSDLHCPVFPLRKTGQAFACKINTPESCIKPMIAITEE
jgi:L-iditol 2-dehydrogenase